MRRATLLSLVMLTATLVVPASALAFYGAIAVNPNTGGYGRSDRQPTKAKAERAALRHCRGACRTLLWVHDDCAAAVLTRTGFWGGFGATPGAALRAARTHARNRHAMLVTSMCAR